jgi:predicted nucleic acid-binding protein
MTIYYADTSALVKLVKEEAESQSLRDFWSSGAEFVSSILAKTELLRAVRNEGRAGSTQARLVLTTVDLLALGDSIAETAIRLDPIVLRTLDALHVASALSLAVELDGVITYDARMAEAVRSVGLRVLAPGT